MTRTYGIKCERCGATVVMEDEEGDKSSSIEGVGWAKIRLDRWDETKIRTSMQDLCPNCVDAHRAFMDGEVTND